MSSGSPPLLPDPPLPQPATATVRSGQGCGEVPAHSAFDQFDPVPVGVAHEADPGATLDDRVRGLFGLDALFLEVRQLAVQVVGRDGDVVVAGAELVGVDAVVVGQLEPRAVVRAGP